MLVGRLFKETLADVNELKGTGRGLFDQYSIVLTFRKKWTQIIGYNIGKVTGKDQIGKLKRI